MDRSGLKLCRDLFFSSSIDPVDQQNIGMQLSKDQSAKPSNPLKIPEKLVWALVIMGVMVLVTIVSL